ncbi:IucA/IucC family protein [Mesorhizobium sp. SB112]|uniref:IucA/IucC family protein n=1 Tax=Mesorhizobium sp. SB112 TaxID=3151853 RepID=UPI0032652362
MPLPLDRHGDPELRIIRQLVEAAIYEGLVDHVASAQDRGTLFEWGQADASFRCEGRIGAFGRIRIRPETIEQQAGNNWVRPAIGDLVSSLKGSAEHRAQLLFELEQTLGFTAWNNDNLPPRLRRDLPFAQLDAGLDEGHPYHPCFKARTGFTHEDHAAYGPEAGNSFQLIWLAVSRAYLHSALPLPEREFWIAELGAETYALLDGRRRECCDDATKFGLLPLHPWQWQALQNSGLSNWISDGSAHFLGTAGDRYIASQSVRTLFNIDHPECANIKLPMNLVNSSAKRIIEPYSVCTAPVLTDWLNDLVSDDPLFSERYPLTILGEYAGVIADRDGPLAGELAVIWRESVDSYLKPGEAAVPLNALMMVEHDGRPFIADWIERHELDRWTDQLIETVAMPIWHLLVAHGFATESHGQNLVLIHRDGWPVRLALRDFHDSLEYAPDFLRDPGKVPDFVALNPAYAKAEPNEFYWMESVELLGELVIDALFIYNLAEISHLLDHCYGLDEAVFWANVSRRLSVYADEHGLAERQNQLGHSKPRIFTESLLTRKLRAPGTICAHEIPNSLSVAA